MSRNSTSCPLITSGTRKRPEQDKGGCCVAKNATPVSIADALPFLLRIHSTHSLRSGPLLRIISCCLPLKNPADFLKGPVDKTTSVLWALCQNGSSAVKIISERSSHADASLEWLTWKWCGISADGDELRNRQTFSHPLPGRILSFPCHPFKARPLSVTAVAGLCLWLKI